MTGPVRAAAGEIPIDKYVVADRAKSEALEDRENADRLFRQALIPACRQAGF